MNDASLPGFLRAPDSLLPRPHSCEFVAWSSVGDACHNRGDREQDQCHDQCECEMSCVCLHVPLRIRG